MSVTRKRRALAAARAYYKSIIQPDLEPDVLAIVDMNTGRLIKTTREPVKLNRQRQKAKTFTME